MTVGGPMEWLEAAGAAAAVGDGDGDWKNRGAGGGGGNEVAIPPTPKTPRRRTKKERPSEQRAREQIEYNRADLKRRYFEFHGVELTDEMLDKAVADAREKGPKRFEEGYKMRLKAKLPGLEEHQEEHSVHRETGRRLQTVTRGFGIIVSALSPGWQWNYGRNEFYCAGFDEIKPPFLPKEGTKITMLDCYNTRYEQISIQYTNDDELIFPDIDGVYWDWCSATNNARKGKLRCERCDITDPLQQWTLLDADSSDGTWRPREDDFRCVTGRPPKSGRDGGGRLKLRACSTKKKTRQAQTFVFCRDTGNCDINDDSGFIDCIIEDECDTF